MSHDLSEKHCEFTLHCKLQFFSFPKLCLLGLMRVAIIKINITHCCLSSLQLLAIVFCTYLYAVLRGLYSMII